MVTYSQISQDIFTFNFFKKQKGYFLDLGCGNGSSSPCGNNTLLLEENGWTGISIDINKEYINQFKKNRSSVAICTDLTQNSLDEILEKNNAPKIIDYLSFDVDEATEIALQTLPLDKYKFKLITFEHNEYIKNSIYSKIKKMAKEKFEFFGYEILIDNVILEGHGAVEDWYINTEETKDFDKKYLANINHKELLKKYNYVKS